MYIQDYPLPKDDPEFWLDMAETRGYRVTKHALGWHQLTPQIKRKRGKPVHLKLKDTGITLVFRKNKLCEIKTN